MRHNYLNNKDILKEIHKSKTSYCSYKNPEDSDYDLILKSVDQINPTNIRKAKKSRAERLTKLNTEAGKPAKVTTRSVADQDVVFRVMTFDHIPPKETVVENVDPEAEPMETEYDEKEPIKYVKLNFPPFQHYRLNKKGKPVCVGKSHWEGDLKDGHFSREHGALTNKLATMFMKLCERYATRSNWRGYTYNDEMRSQALLQLIQIGLQFNEAKSQNPFAYYTAVISNTFTRVLNIEKRNQSIRDDILEMNNLSPSYTRQNQNSASYEDY